MSRSSVKHCMRPSPRSVIVYLVRIWDKFAGPTVSDEGMGIKRTEMDSGETDPVDSDGYCADIAKSPVLCINQHNSEAWISPVLTRGPPLCALC